jgi:hypothetical protein
VTHGITALNIPGIESRRKGPNKGRKERKFITPGPDWLWCCDGHKPPPSRDRPTGRPEPSAGLLGALDRKYPATVNPLSGDLVFDSSMKIVKSRKLGPRSRSERISLKALKQIGGACEKHKTSKKKVSINTRRSGHAEATGVLMLSGHQCFKLMDETFVNIEGRTTVSN